MSWQNDRVQFARLLTELVANEYDIDAAADSMEISSEELDELFERAHKAWEAAKRNVQDVHDLGELPPGGSGWLTVNNVSVLVARHDEGVAISCYKLGHEDQDAFVETWALYSEVDEVDKDWEE